MQQFLVIVYVAVAGVLTAVQSGANAQLVRSLERPWIVAVVVSLVTTSCFLAALLVMRQPLPDTGRIAAAPWWAWTGGICGALYVTGTLLFAQRLGAGAFTGITVTAGIVASLVLDHYGLVGFEQHAASVWRILGALLMVAGVALFALF